MILVTVTINSWQRISRSGQMPIAQFIGISCKYSVVFDLQHLCFNLQNLFLTFKMSHTRGEKNGRKIAFSGRNP